MAAFIHERDLQEGSVEAPVSVNHMVAPWTIGSRSLWVGVATLAPGASTKAHALEAIEGVHVTLEGSGTETVGGEEIQTEPGTFVLIPPNTLHQIVNTGDRPLKVLSITSPPIQQPA